MELILGILISIAIVVASHLLNPDTVHDDEPSEFDEDSIHYNWTTDPLKWFWPGNIYYRDSSSEEDADGD